MAKKFPKRTPITVLVTPAAKRWLKAHAKRNHRNVSAQIAQWITDKMEATK